MGKAQNSIINLANAAKGKIPASDVLQIVQTFRQDLSLNWIKDFIQSNLAAEDLVQTWLNLFTLVDHSDVNVRVATFGAIGALILMTAPIYPNILTETFCQAVPSVDFSPNKSVSLISSYLYLVNYLPFTLRNNFIERVNIMPHFSSDISQFIRHIPHLIPLMKPLDCDIQKAFLRSIVVSFARSQSAGFNEAVLEMVKLNPEVLLDDSFEFLISNNIVSAILSLASTFMLDETIFKFLSEHYLQLFEKEAMKILRNPESQLGDVENSVSIISTLLKMSRQVEGLNDIDFSLFPKHYRKFILQIDPNIESLKIDEDKDSQIIIQSKLRALIHIKDGNFVLSIFDKFSELNQKGDTFTTFVNCFQMCFNKIKYVNRQTVAKIIGRIILTKTDTWVEQNSIIELIGEIGDEGTLFMNDFEETSINILLNSAVSQHDPLVKNAISKLCKLATQDTLQTIIKFLYSCDLFDMKVTRRILLILNALVHEFGPEQFVQFKGIVREITLFNQDVKIVGNAFSFLRKIDFKADQQIVDCGINWICILYRSYTQIELGLSTSINNKSDDPNMNIVVPNVLSIIETDIISSDLLFTKSSVMKSLNSIFKFLIQQEIGNAISVFPEMIQLNPNLIKLCHMSIEDVLKVFNESRSYKTTALACDEMKHEDIHLIPILSKVIDKILQERVIFVPYLASMYRLMMSNQEYEEKIKQRLSEAEYKLFQMKLKKNRCSLTQAQFNSLPTSELCFEFIDGPILIDDLFSLDFPHLKFVFQNRDHFVVKSGFEEISKLSFQKVPIQTMKIKPFERDLTTSLIPELALNGTLSKSLILINSFFESSDLKRDQKLFDNLFNYLVMRLDETSQKIEEKQKEEQDRIQSKASCSIDSNGNEENKANEENIENKVNDTNNENNNELNNENKSEDTNNESKSEDTNIKNENEDNNNNENKSEDANNENKVDDNNESNNEVSNENKVEDTNNESKDDNVNNENKVEDTNNESKDDNVNNESKAVDSNKDSQISGEQTETKNEEEEEVSLSDLIYTKERIIKAIKSGLKYSIKFNFTVNDDTIISLLCHEVLLPLLTKKINDKQKVLKAIYDKLHVKEETALLLNVLPDINEKNSFTLYDFEISLDTERQFHLFFEHHFRLKKKILKKLCFWVQRYNYSGEELVQLMQSIFDSIGEVQSNLKILFILRLVQSFLCSLAQYSAEKSDFQPKHAMPFIQSLADIFKPIQTADIDSLHNEISSIFNYVFIYIRPTQDVASSFNTFDLQLKHTSVYLRPMTTSYVFSSLSSFRLSKSGIQPLLTSSMTSYSTKLMVLKAFRILLFPNASTQSFCLFEMSMPLLFKTVEKFKNSPEFATVIAEIFLRAMKHPNFNNIKSVFVPQAVNIAFTILPSSASFIYYAPVLQQLLVPLGCKANLSTFNAKNDTFIKVSQQAIVIILNFMQFVNSNSRTSMYNISSIYSSCCDFLILNELRNKTAKTATAAEKKMNDIKLQKLLFVRHIFLIDPDSVTRKALINSITQNFDGFDRNYYLFSKVALLRTHFLQCYVLVCEYLKNSTEKDKKEFMSLMNDNVKVLSSQNKFESLSKLMEGKVMEGAVLASACQ